MVCLFVGHVVVTCNHTLLDRVLTGLLIYGVCLLGIVEKISLLGADDAQCDLRTCSCLVTARICSKSFDCLITVTGTPIERVLDELFVWEVYFLRIFDKHVFLELSSPNVTYVHFLVLLLLTSVRNRCLFWLQLQHSEKVSAGWAGRLRWVFSQNASKIFYSWSCRRPMRPMYMFLSLSLLTSVQNRCLFWLQLQHSEKALAGSVGRLRCLFSQNSLRIWSYWICRRSVRSLYMFLPFHYSPPFKIVGCVDYSYNALN